MLEAIRKQQIRLSIIIPVYNTEKYFARCIESIEKQSYKNLEIIVVDDASPGNIAEMMEKYAAEDKRIRFIRNKTNQGLFRTRVLGAKKASGDYIAFLDSDDYVSMDYYHRLLAKAAEEQADIVIGRTVWEEPDGERYIYNWHQAAFHFHKLCGDEAASQYFGQKNRCYSWHTIWNKIYSKKLWDRCMPWYEKVDRHIIMTEDIGFSSLLFYFAKSVAVQENDAYFYCVNSNSSTNANGITIERFCKNVSDIAFVFDFVEKFLKEQKASAEIRRNFRESRRFYGQMWRSLGRSSFKGEEKRQADRILCTLWEQEEEIAESDYFFERMRTKWNGGLEYFKEEIAKGDYSQISFDIFDTLISRPFYEPGDLFKLLDKEFEKYSRANVSFASIRADGENSCREKMARIHPEYEDVSLDEIYEEIAELYHIDKSICKKMQEEECRLEILFCSQRNAGRELYELALLTGKKVVLTTDMYLDENTIKRILEKNGYYGYQAIYLSSRERKLKYNGKLFSRMLAASQAKAEEVLHIGDTWGSDMEGSKKAGISSLFLPKAKEIFENKIQGIATNNCGHLEEMSAAYIQNSTAIKKSIGYRCMLAMAANLYFDNPYRSFYSDSDFNADPYFIGFYAVGMHLMGLAKWLGETGKQMGYGKIYFFARDGYLPMKVYEKYRLEQGDFPAAEYMYASRKAVLPGMIGDETDLFHLPIEFRAHSPETLLEIMKFMTRNVKEQEVRELLKRENISYDRKFEDRKTYMKFIGWFRENLFAQEVLEENRRLAGKYYGKIREDEAAFDMGYSGRIQKAVSSLCGHGVDVFFVHEDSISAEEMKRKGGFRIYNFYDYTPAVSGLMREHILSETGGSCIGFAEKNGQAVPVLENEERTAADLFTISCLHKGAIDFAGEFLKSFQGYLSYVPFKSQEVSLPFEYFLNMSGAADLSIFSASYFEDTVYGAQKSLNVRDFIAGERAARKNRQTPLENIEYLPGGPSETLIDMNHYSKPVRGAVFFLTNKKVFMEKMKKNCKKLWRKGR